MKKEKKNKTMLLIYDLVSVVMSSFVIIAIVFAFVSKKNANGKMSKSSGKALTLSLLEENGYDPLVYRFFCLQSHYRKNLVFSWEGLDNAVIAYNKLVAKIASLNPVGEADENDFNAVKAGFVSAMDNDLNTSLAITAVYDALKAKVSDATKIALIKDYEKVLSLGLINAVEKYDTPIVEINTTTETNNLQALRLYKNLGFLEDYSYPQSYMPIEN